MVGLGDGVFVIEKWHTEIALGIKQEDYKFDLGSARFNLI